MDIKNKKQWADHFLEACQDGEIEDVRHLCQKKYLDLGWADIHCYENENYGFRWACENGHLEVVKYLLTSPELIEAGHTWATVHHCNDDGFCMACYHKHWDVVRWLVLDYGIEKTPAIEEMIQEDHQAQEYFRIREELKEIQSALNEKSISGPISHQDSDYKKDEWVSKKAKKL